MNKTVTETINGGKFVNLNKPLFETDFEVVPASSSHTSKALTVCQPISLSINSSGNAKVNAIPSKLNAQQLALNTINARAEDARRGTNGSMNGNRNLNGVLKSVIVSKDSGNMNDIVEVLMFIASIR